MKAGKYEKLAKAYQKYLRGFCKNALDELTEKQLRIGFGQYMTMKEETKELKKGTSKNYLKASDAPKKETAPVVTESHYNAADVVEMVKKTKEDKGQDINAPIAIVYKEYKDLTKYCYENRLPMPQTNAFKAKFHKVKSIKDLYGHKGFNNVLFATKGFDDERLLHALISRLNNLISVKIMFSLDEQEYYLLPDNLEGIFFEERTVCKGHAIVLAQNPETTKLDYKDDSISVGDVCYSLDEKIVTVLYIKTPE